MSIYVRQDQETYLFISVEHVNTHELSLRCVPQKKEGGLQISKLDWRGHHRHRLQFKEYGEAMRFGGLHPSFIV